MQIRVKAPRAHAPIFARCCQYILIQTALIIVGIDAHKIGIVFNEVAIAEWVILAEAQGSAVIVTGKFIHITAILIGIAIWWLEDATTLSKPEIYKPPISLIDFPVPASLLQQSQRYEGYGGVIDSNPRGHELIMKCFAGPVG